MLAQYHSNVKATITFLRLLGVKVNSGTVNETLQNHPDWPSLLCISDSLNKWDIPKAAGTIDKEAIWQLPIPFLANILKAVTKVFIVNKVSKVTISIPVALRNQSLKRKKNLSIKSLYEVILMYES